MCFSDIFKLQPTGKYFPNTMCFTVYFSNRAAYMWNEFYPTTKQETFDFQLINFGNMLPEIKICLADIHGNTSLQQYFE